MFEDTPYITRQIREGNLEEFEKVFKEFYPQLCLYALRFVKTKDLSEEIVQNLFCQIWENRRNLDIHTSIKAYLYRSTYHNALQLLRKKEVIISIKNTLNTILMKIHLRQTILKKRK